MYLSIKMMMNIDEHWLCEVAASPTFAGASKARSLQYDAI